MKQLLLICLLAVSFVSFGQSTAVNVPVLGMPTVADLNQKDLNANNLRLKQEVLLIIPVMNSDQVHALKASGSLSIDLGSKLQAGEITKGEALSNYFSWSSLVNNDSHVILTGRLVADIPADFYGKLSLPVVAIAEGKSDIEFIWNGFQEKKQNKDNRNISLTVNVVHSSKKVN